MEKFSQFRDKGSGIAPFLPIPLEAAGIYLPFYTFLFAIRIPFLITFILCYFFFLQWLPIGAVGKKLSIWSIMGVPGLWWIDLQIDGVRKGQVNSQREPFPQPGAILAASSTSPIDPLYLAAIFDPIFTQSFPSSRKVKRISLLEAVYRAFSYPQIKPHESSVCVSLSSLAAENPGRYIVVFPETTTSNGRGILPLSPSILSASPKTRIYPVSLKYSPQDITTPIPHSYLTFLWNLCSRPTHSIRTRIAGYRQVPAPASAATTSGADAPTDNTSNLNLSDSEKEVLDWVAQALARLGRNQRVALGVVDKQRFIAMWTKTHRR